MNIDTQIGRLNNIIQKILLKINIENNLYDYFFNHLCEDIFTVTFSEIFDDRFTNTNIENPNSPGIDLISKKRKICIQISSSGTTTKLYKSLRTFLKQEEYKDCEKLYFFIIGEKDGSYSEAKENIKKILLEDTVKIKGFQFDVDKDIIELKYLSEILKNKFSELHGNNNRKLSHESLFKIVEDLSKSVEGIEYALKSILEVDRNEYLRNNCLEISNSINRRLIDEQGVIFSKEDLINKEEFKYFFIYGDAGLGKTHLLNELSFELFENSKEKNECKLPFIINLKDLKFNISLEKQLPQYFGKRYESLLILDGYDEITLKEQVQFKNLLINYLELNKKTSCIIGSRTKINQDDISFFIKNDTTKRKYYFKPLKIDFFNDEEINDFIYKKGVDTTIYSDQNYPKLKIDFKNPYYLDLATNYYNDYGFLPESKLIILDKLLNKSFIRLTEDENRMLALETRNYLEKITFLFYYTEIKDIKDIELAKIIKYKNEVWKLLNKHETLIFNEKYEYWEISLIKQKELDYLFYSLLKKIDSETLLKIFQEDIILPDAWYNSLILFNDDNEINIDIRDRITNIYPFIYIKEFQINPFNSIFSRNLRIKVFQKIFNKYEAKDIWIDFKIFDEKSYVEFGDILENFNFLILKINSDNRRTKNKAISLLRKFIPSQKRTDILIPVLCNEINKDNDKNIIWEIYYCLSKYKDFINIDLQKKIINLSSKSEFEFLKNNEYIRAAVYHFINVCNLEEDYTDYMLEGLVLLKKSISRNDLIEGRSEISLMDEGFNLDNLFYKIKSKKKIIEVYEILFNNYSAYNNYHTDNILERLISNSKDIIYTNKNNKHFINAFINIFSKYDELNDNWFYWKEMIINFKLDKFIIETLKAEKEVLEKLINKKKIFKNHFLVSVDGISKLITENSYHLIIESVDKKLIRIEDAVRIYEFVDNRDEKLSKKLKSEIIKRGGSINNNIKIKNDDLKEEQIKNFELLFNEDNFKKEVLSFFKKSNTIELSWAEIPEWYNDNLYFNNDVKIEFLRTYFNKNSINKSEVIKEFRNGIKDNLIETILNKKLQFKYDFSENQIIILENWLKEQISKLDFRNAIHNVENNSFSINQNCNTIYKYVQELDINLDKKTNLDLLSFIDINRTYENYNSEYESYFEILIAKIGDIDAVKRRVNENLVNKIKYSASLNNHIIFSYKHNIIENYKLIEDLLTEILPELQIGHYHDNPLIVYYDKSKNFEFIKKSFPSITTDLFWTIIDYLIINNENLEFVEEKLLLNIEKTEDYNEKLKFASKLLKINSKDALSKFYLILNHIKVKQLEGEYRLYAFKESINEYKNLEIKAAVDLLELTFKFYFDNFDNPIREISTYLKRMIIENKDNYDEIKKLITSVIESNTGIIDNIQFLEYELNDYRETFYSNYKSNYSLKDALKIISEID